MIWLFQVAAYLCAIKKSKSITMKKFFAVLAIAGTLVACNDNGNANEAVDSTATNGAVDSSAVTPMITPDSTAPAVDTTGAAAGDTTASN